MVDRWARVDSARRRLHECPRASRPKAAPRSSLRVPRRAATLETHPWPPSSSPFELMWLGSASAPRPQLVEEWPKQHSRRHPVVQHRGIGNAFPAFPIRMADHELHGNSHPLGVQEVGCGQLMQDSQLVRVVAIQDGASRRGTGNVVSLIGIGPRIDARLRIPALVQPARPSGRHHAGVRSGRPVLAHSFGMTFPRY